MKSLKSLAFAGAMLVLTAGVVAAQQSGPGYGMGPWMMGNGMMYGQSMGPWMMGQTGAMPMMGWGAQNEAQRTAMCNAMAGHIEGRLAYLKAELKITDAQAPLWEAYATAARNNSQSMQAHCTAMMGQTGTATPSLPDRLDLHEQFMAAQLDALRAMNKALKPLYAALDANQKRTADQYLWGPMGMM